MLVNIWTVSGPQDNTQEREWCFLAIMWVWHHLKQTVPVLPTMYHTQIASQYRKRKTAPPGAVGFLEIRVCATCLGDNIAPVSATQPDGHTRRRNGPQAGANPCQQQRPLPVLQLSAAQLPRTPSRKSATYRTRVGTEHNCSV